MKKALSLLIAAAALCGAAAVSAQSGPGPAASGASAPRMGMGMDGRGGMMGRRFGPDNTPGWSMMTPAERGAHRDRMHSFKTEAECRAYMDEQHKLMSERAKERGRTVPATPRHDPCAGLPK